MLWLPYVLFFAFFNVEWRKLDFEEPKETEKRDWKGWWDSWRDWEAWKQWRPWRTWRTWAAPLFLGVIGVWNVAIATWPPQSYLMIYLTTFLIWVWARLHRRMFPPLDVLSDEQNSIYQRIVKFGPPSLIVVFTWGMVQGSSDAKSVGDPYLVKFKDRERAEERIFLRNFDRGLLMRNAVSQKIEFHRWDEVVTLERVPREPAGPLACYLITAFCPPPATSPPAPEVRVWREEDS